MNAEIVQTQSWRYKTIVVIKRQQQTTISNKQTNKPLPCNWKPCLIKADRWLFSPLHRKLLQGINNNILLG